MEGGWRDGGGMEIMNGGGMERWRQGEMDGGGMEIMNGGRMERWMRYGDYEWRGDGKIDGGGMEIMNGERDGEMEAGRDREMNGRRDIWWRGNGWRDGAMLHYVCVKVDQV